MLAALKLMTTMVEEKVRLSELRDIFEPFPQAQVSLMVRKKTPLESLDGVQKLIQKVETQLGMDGRVLVRYSGTEPKARVLVEGPDLAHVSTCANEIAEEMKRVVG